VEVSTDGGSNWTDLVADTKSTSTAYSHTGLSAGLARHYRVSAINSVGPGAASNVANASTAAAAAPGAPTSLTAVASGRTIINLGWAAPTNTGGAAITGYKIEVSTDGGSTFTALVASQTSRTYSHTGLTAGLTRHYRVYAINSVGSSPASNVANASTAALAAPGAPTSLTATASGQTIINLSWSAPTNTGGAAITGYRLEISTDAGTNWTSLVADTRSTGTTYSHTGLSAGTTRYYRVSAINSVGPGAASNVANATTAATTPGAPTSLTAAASGQTIINLSWTAPTNTGGAAITGYKVEVSPNGTNNSWTGLVADTKSANTAYSHTGLSAGTTRYYRVSAINRAGTGPMSNVANATTNVPVATTPGARHRSPQPPPGRRPSP